LDGFPLLFVLKFALVLSLLCLSYLWLVFEAVFTDRSGNTAHRPIDTKWHISHLQKLQPLFAEPFSRKPYICGAATSSYVV